MRHMGRLFCFGCGFLATKAELTQATKGWFDSWPALAKNLMLCADSESVLPVQTRFKAPFSMEKKIFWIYC